MATAVVLLRGVNVGGHRKIPMAGLRDACRDAGFANVRSYIQSGNLVLDSDIDPDRIEAAVEAEVERRFGFAVDALARTAAQWREYIAGNPLAAAAAADPAKVMLVLSRPALGTDAIAALRTKAAGVETIETVGDAVYIQFPDGGARSRLAGQLARLPATVRNWRTVSRLPEIADEPA